MKFNMIVVMTSCAPKILSSPGMAPHSQPPKPAATIAATRTNGPGPGMVSATATPAMAPMNSWPSPPILNRPARNGTATARPVKMSGVALTMVRPEGAGQQRGVGGEHVVAGRDDPQRPDRQRQQHSDQRKDQSLAGGPQTP